MSYNLYQQKILKSTNMNYPANMSLKSTFNNLESEFNYCINPKCIAPKNAVSSVLCSGCGSQLLLDGQYRVIQKLGDNGFIATYRVNDDDEEKILKVLHNYTEEKVEIFKKQIEILSHNEYQGIANIELNSYFRFFPKNIETPLHCVLIEKVEGETLQKWMEAKDFPIRETLAINWLLQLTKILGKLHSKEIIHGSINPDHIILQPSGDLILTALPSLPDVFTKSYAPREQEEGFMLAESDFFSLGRTFVFLLTKTPPLALYQPYQDELHWRELNPNLNSQLADFIDYLMKRFAKNRPPNTDVIRRRLTEIQDHLKKKLSQPTISYSVNQSSENQTQIVIPEISEESKRKKRKKKNIRKKKKVKIVNFIKENLIVTVSSTILFFIVASQSYSYIKDKYTSNPFVILNSILNLNKTFKGDLGSISELTFSDDGENLAAASRNTIKILDVAQEMVINNLDEHTDTVEAIAFSPDKSILVSGSADQNIKIWNPITGRVKKTIYGPNATVNSITFSYDGVMFATSSSNGMISLWNTSSGLLINNIIAHQDRISSIDFSPDGDKLVSGSFDKTIRIWDVNTARRLLTLDAHELWINSVQFSPDGKIIASASGDRTVKLWNAKTGELINTLTGHSDDVSDVSFSQDGKYLASASSDRKVKIWEVNSGKLIKTFAGHTRKINTVTFSPTENKLASADQNGNIKIWKVD